jgi:hypothetical protein
MRAMGVRGLLIYCSDYHCSHWTAITGDRWPDDVRLSDLEPLFVARHAAGAALKSARTSIEAEARPAKVPDARRCGGSLEKGSGSMAI